ncbi:bifunctional metallophosphatase/5'-nucleotidase [Cecembia lonarensis]|uniref:Trifunctional nucleotide phosphoesterase protein YfkN n=1 Tax=Cecembia lonarensis (strain CCUG 58316 / KCTC 22772 / LW9) TaxID=1225176 RepID=K1L5Y0_CECL9|nr:metallophosphatase [Cecembia lonarensis]EKB50161.1 Trifunctional nucleotide phosphoesterase protein YfkN precursor [Cecembia lonarensis LW9]
MDRRKFIKNSLMASAALGFGQETFATGLSPVKSKTISILHTNDMHSRIEPFPNDGGRWANQGGMTKLAALVSDIRKQEENVLLLDAGDVFQGTPYFNFYGGELEFKLMSKMGFDAATMGNHEFDNGLTGFYDQLPHTNFPYICSNYDFSQTILKDAVLPYRVIKKSGLRIGIFGLGIELYGLVAKKNFEATVYEDPVAVSREMVQELKSKKADLVICLSHLGYSYRTQKIDDLKLAAAISGIDLIIGGHTHTFLEEPTLIKNADGHQTIIHQVGTGALRLGKVDFEFGKENQIIHAKANSLPIF